MTWGRGFQVNFNYLKQFVFKYWAMLRMYPFWDNMWISYYTSVKLFRNYLGGLICCVLFL